ncbi:MAG TPA: hypothetical protein PLA85_10810, partial [Micropepsaceae bacterium]|nr:hypothetical protein [Micropepsaceae bacterium]
SSPRSSGIGPLTGARIVVENREEKMIAPCAINAQISPRQPLLHETAFAQEALRRLIGGQARSL